MTTRDNPAAAGPHPVTPAAHRREDQGIVRHDMTAEDLSGAPVFGLGDERIGSITDLVVTADGKISEVIVDVGGFPGLGARSVAIAFADLTIMRDDSGGEFRIRIDATGAQLEDMPHYAP